MIQGTSEDTTRERVSLWFRSENFGQGLRDRTTREPVWQRSYHPDAETAEEWARALAFGFDGWAEWYIEANGAVAAGSSTTATRPVAGVCA